LERSWWQLFWQLRRQRLPVEVMAADMAEIAVTLEGMLSKDMPRPAMSGVDTLDSVLAVDVVTNLRGPHAGTAAMQRAHIIGMAAVTGEAITGIRPMDILGSAITAWAMATHTMEVATTVTVMVGIIRTTEIGDTTLTSTDTGRP
jgi:hypothetical protein